MTVQQLLETIEDAKRLYPELPNYIITVQTPPMDGDIPEDAHYEYIHIISGKLVIAYD